MWNTQDFPNRVPYPEGHEGFATEAEQREHEKSKKSSVRRIASRLSVSGIWKKVLGR